MGKFSISSQTRHILGPKIAEQMDPNFLSYAHSQMLNAMDIYLHLPLKVAKCR